VCLSVVDTLVALRLTVRRKDGGAQTLATGGSGGGEKRVTAHTGEVTALLPLVGGARELLHHSRLASI
jgi:hypothetical protein